MSSYSARAPRTSPPIFVPPIFRLTTNAALRSGRWICARRTMSTIAAAAHTSYGLGCTGMKMAWLIAAMLSAIVSGLPKVWGSGSHGHAGGGFGFGIEQMTEAGAELA